MSSIIKVDQIQTASGGTPTLSDLGVSTAGTGKLLQIVQAQSTSVGAVTSTSFVEYMSTSITPSSTSSQILIMFSAPLGYEDSRGGSSFYYNQTIYRDSTNLGVGSGLTGTYQHSLSYNDYGVNNGGMSIVDSPSTTSSVTYKVMHKMGGSGIVRMCLEGRANLILMEIAG